MAKRNIVKNGTDVWEKCNSSSVDAQINTYINVSTPYKALITMPEVDIKNVEETIFNLPKAKSKKGKSRSATKNKTPLSGGIATADNKKEGLECEVSFTGKA